MADDDRSAADIAETLQQRASDINVFLTVDTLEYLKKGGRISGAQAAIGTLLSVKPIIKVEDGIVETVERVRTRSKARERMVELATARPIERMSVLHTMAPDVEAFRTDMLARLPELDPESVSIELVGASVGPHLGPELHRGRGAVSAELGPPPGRARAIRPDSIVATGPKNIATGLREPCHPVPSCGRRTRIPGYTRGR